MDSIPVLFAPEMVANVTSRAPSARKPKAVVDRWLAQHLPIRVFRPKPVDQAALTRAHDAEYVHRVLALEECNGFGNRSAELARSLPWTSGAMLSAARAAITSRAVACAPCSGFHHAGWDSGGGYCTFNGLMVAACALRAGGLARCVGILDCDMHYGNGTDDIIRVLNAGGWVRHFSAGAIYESPSQASEFLGSLPGVVVGMADCDVILYQAGADPHVDDPLGGFLTTEQLAMRDAIVFREAQRLAVPLAWDLAGGYQLDEGGSIEPVLRIHENTMRACAEAWGLDGS